MTKKIYYRLFHVTESGVRCLIGTVCPIGEGWIFNPNVAGRKSSRKVWDTPQWAKKQTDLVVVK